MIFCIIVVEAGAGRTLAAALPHLRSYGVPVEDGRIRIVIEGVKPEIDCGRFPIKRTVGERVEVEADIFADGHDTLSARLLYRKKGDTGWSENPMEHLVNDRWHGSFEVAGPGSYQYTITAWVDRFHSWQKSLAKKAEAGQDVSVELLVGAQFIDEASRQASAADMETIQQWAGIVESAQVPDATKLQLALSDETAELLSKYLDRRFAAIYSRELEVVVDRQKARFSSWYEMFPRCCTPAPPDHGTFRDCEARLPYIADMGFDVLYFPPIHPVGRTHRKGRNNAPVASLADPGSPWAIGSEEGGHKAIDPRLGTVEDFRHLVARAREHGMEIALDLAFNCTPDHPYVKEHPEWFHRRPDGTIQYAENPPKKYEDIYPLNFESDDWWGLWKELRSVVLYWIEQGVHIFRVDNPHTKPFRFWEWLITEIKGKYPDVIFLAEAFTRPKVMYRLAKLGFTQSYTYFAWRNTKWELTQYFTELTQTEVREYFRPNLWPNTPDILTEYLQTGGRAAFMSRLVLAATLGASYGIYGPAFELGENRSREPGSEEYLNSEKYEIRCWEINRPDSLAPFIALVNRIRRENPALQSDWSLRFHSLDNEQLICYSKHTEDLDNIILVVVNLDTNYTQSGWIYLPLETLGLDPNQPFQVRDLLSNAYYLWHGPRNYVEINPHIAPAHIFQVRRRVHTERDFAYYM